MNADLRYAGVVYNGIDMDLYRRRTDKEDFVLFLGRAAPEKGRRRAVDAANLAGARLVSAVKIARPTEREEWETNVKPALPPDAVVLGEIPQEEKVDLLRRPRPSCSRSTGRAFRPGDDGGDGLRDPGDRHAQGLGARGRSTTASRA